MPRNPVVLIHGYSDTGRSFARWRDALEQRGYDVTALHVASYRTLTNEVTIKDIAEGLDRALRLRAGLDGDEPFDAVVHSTGMLVIRAWLTAYAARRGRLKHLIGLAPASFGSPLAHKGRSLFGAIFKGSKDLGPDFLEAGDRVLDGLELASRFTWDLAHRDLLLERPGDAAYYGPGADTPYVFVFCGTARYAGLRRLVGINQPGTDGTVRLAGCALNTRKIVVDLSKDPSLEKAAERLRFQPWSNLNIPLIPVAGVNHGTILADPSQPLVEMVDEALQVSDGATFERRTRAFLERTAGALDGIGPWQQFVVRATDERGDPITDYHVELAAGDGKRAPLPFDLDVHTYQGDPSLRCFHVDLGRLRPERLTHLRARLTVSSGTELVGYYGHVDEMAADERPKTWWEGALDLSPLLTDPAVRFFYPFTTTLIELVLNREPLPRNRPNRVFAFAEAEP